MTTEKILDKLSKLKAARDGEAAIGNAAAAEAFAGMINRMLLQHELSEIDIPINADADPIVELLVDPRRHGIAFSRVRVGWQEALAGIVARAHLCKFLVTRGTNFVTFVGTRSHVAVAEYAYVVLVNAAATMSFKAREEWWKTECGGQHLKSGNYRAAWLSGFVSRIAERFVEARRAVVQASGNASTALVRLNQQLVRAEAYVGEKYKRKSPATSMSTGNWDGVKAGRAAADKVALGQKGVEGGSTTKFIR